MPARWRPGIRARTFEPLSTAAGGGRLLVPRSARSSFRLRAERSPRISEGPTILGAEVTRPVVSARRGRTPTRRSARGEMRLERARDLLERHHAAQAAVAVDGH